MGKFFLIFIISSISLFGAQKVLLAKKNFQYKEIIREYDLLQRNTYKALNRDCVALDLETLKANQYYTLHYIKKGSIICVKDVERYIRRSVKFDFGSFEIEKAGEVIQETDDFVRIKTRDGKVEKIYKDGHSR